MFGFGVRFDAGRDNGRTRRTSALEGFTTDLNHGEWARRRWHGSE
jgi:hypothetical protein